MKLRDVPSVDNEDDRHNIKQKNTERRPWLIFGNSSENPGERNMGKDT